MICVFRCVNCGDRMTYSIERECLHCTTCGSDCEIDAYDTKYITYEGMAMHDEGVEILTCPSCAAKVTVLEGSASLKCSYCHSDLTVFGIHKGEMSPEYIIPLSVTKEQARSKLINWWLDHKSMPKLDEKKLDMKYQDIYVPVWLIDAQAVTSMKADYIPYDGDGNVYHVPIKKKYESRFINVPFDSSCHIENEQFHNVEPFQYDQMEEFNPTYISGHLAECYHFGPNETLAVANTRLKEFSKKLCYDYMDVDIKDGEIDSITQSETDITPSAIKYALVPMWVCSYEYKGQRRSVYVNGQTGKTDGEVLFDNNNYKTGVSIYAALAFIINICMGLVLAMTITIKGGIYILYALASQFAVVIVPVIGSLLQTITDSNKNNKMEEIQMKQGMKWSFTQYNMINLVLVVICIGIASAFAPFYAQFDAFSYFIALLTGVIGSLIMTSLAIKKVKKYDQYVRKTEYFDYVKVSSVREITNPEKGVPVTYYY